MTATTLGSLAKCGSPNLKWLPVAVHGSASEKKRKGALVRVESRLVRDSSVRGGSWLHSGWKEAVPCRHVAPHQRRTSSSRVSSATLHVTKWRVLVARGRESTSPSLEVVLTDTPRHRWLHVGIRRFLRFIDMARLLRFVNGCHQDSLHQQGRNRDRRITERYDGMCVWAMRMMTCFSGRLCS